VAEQNTAHYFETALATGANAKSLANWMIGSLFGLLNTHNVDRDAIDIAPIRAEALGELVKLVDSNTINKNTAALVLAEMWATGQDAAAIVEVKGLAQISDTSAIDAMILTVIDDNATMVSEYLGGKDKLFNPLVGKVMAAMGGKGDPKAVRERLQSALDGRKNG